METLGTVEGSKTNGRGSSTVPMGKTRGASDWEDTVEGLGLRV